MLDSSTRQIIQGEERFERGEFREALALFEHVLSTDLSNDGALNDAALTCAELGDIDRAGRFFEQALAYNPTNHKAFFNYLDLLRGIGCFDKASTVFGRFQAAIPDSEEKRRYGDHVTTSRGDGLSHVHHSVSSAVPAHAAQPVSRIKIAFVCMRNDHFVKDVEESLAQHHDVRTLHFNYGRVDLQAVQNIMDWADVTWFEWFDALLVEASRRLRKTSGVVSRLHRFEAFTDWPSQVNWDFLDSLVLVAPPMLDALRLQHPEAERRVDVDVIYNGVDTNRFAFKERKPGYDVACVADLRSRKNPCLMLQCIEALRREDPRYVLHIAGGAKEPDAKLYFDYMVDAMGLSDNVRHYGWVSEIDAWLEDKNYVLSTSIHESFGYGIVESMARGLKPLIHNFPGAETLFPSSAVFNTVPEFVQGVIDEEYDSYAYRAFIERNYALDLQIERISALLQRVVSHGQPVVSHG